MRQIKNLDPAGWAARVKRHAQDELKEERFREEVEALKAKLRQARWWHRVFPWQILIRRRD